VRSWQGVVWSLECICDEDGDWYRALAPRLLELVPESFFWSELSHASTTSTKPAKLTAAAFKKAVTAATRTWDLASSAADHPPLSLHCHRLDNQIGFQLTLHDESWRGAGAGLARSLEALSRQFIAALRDTLIFSSDSGVYPSFYPKLDYPHVDNRLRNPIFRYDLVMNILDRRMVPRLTAVGQAEPAAMMKRICAAAPPRGVRRVAGGDQTVLVWTDELHDEAALATAAAAHERWLDKAIRGKS
jgi:hypothetical protein